MAGDDHKRTFEAKVKVMSNALTEALIIFSKKGMSVTGIVGSVYNNVINLRGFLGFWGNYC